MRRLGKLACRIAISNFRELSLPYRLTYAVTSRCQARCVMCGIWRKQTSDELSLAEIDSFFARNNWFSWINLTGGELFLREDFGGIIHSIHRHCRSLYLLNFPTNGWETDDIVATVREILTRTLIPRVMVTVSLDGPQELHDRIRGLPGSYESAMATFLRLRELRSHRFSVCLGYTLQDANLDAYQDTVVAIRSHLMELTEDEIHVNLAHVSAHYYANGMFDGIEARQNAGEVLAAIELKRLRGVSPISFLERTYQRLARTYLSNGRSPVPCQAAGVSCFLGPTGTVYPCTSFDAPLGNVRDCDYDLIRVWQGIERQNVRRAICSAACPGCWTPCEAYQSILANLLRKSVHI